jgi:dTDP-4-dehydrorhamnose reductase
MKILVTGRDGQLARSLVERGASRGLNIISVGRPELDLERPESIASAIAAAAPDLVINAAAYTAVDQAEDEPELARRINGTAAGEVAAAARRAGARVIQISTDYVFDGRSDQPYREDASTNPLGAYGRSKLDGEEAVRAANPDHAIVRTAWVYSPFGRNFVKTMLDLARSRDSLTIVGDQQGNPSSALDLADGLLTLVSRWRDDPAKGRGETYHLTGAGSTSWDMFARQIFAEAAKLGGPSAEVRSIRSEDYPTKAARPRNSRLDCLKFECDFGYRAPAWQLSTAQIVGRLIRHDG